MRKVPMSNHFSEELRAATESECQARWSCGKPGQFFRCGFCGHKFQVGDKFRCIFTNDIPGAGGNPIVCEKCNGTTAELRGRWLSKVTEFRQLCNHPANWNVVRLYVPELE